MSFLTSTGKVKVSLEGPRTPEYSGVRVTVPPAPPCTITSTAREAEPAELSADNRQREAAVSGSGRNDDVERQLGSLCGPGRYLVHDEAAAPETGGPSLRDAVDR